MVWFKIDDGFASSEPVMRVPRRYRASVIGLWTLSGTWCAKELTDGRVPAHMIEELAGTKAQADQLVSCGLWSKTPTGYVFKGWEKYQPTRAEVEESRRKEAERKAKWRMSQRDTEGTPPSVPLVSQPESGHPDPTRPDPTTSKEVETSLTRPDVIALCELLASLIERNGSLKPTITKAWMDAARLMLDNDHRDPEAAARLIRWCQADSFWHANILSMKKFREKYDALRLAANSERESRKQSGFDQGVDIVRQLQERETHAAV